MFTDVSNFIKDLGFPIFVSCFLLIKTNKTLRKLEIAITSLVIFLKHEPPTDSDKPQ